MKFVLAMALGVAALAACANAPVAPDAPHPSDTCIMLQQGTQFGQSRTRLTDEQRTLMRSITAERLPPPTYQCGDAQYQTDPRQLGLTFTGVGFSADHRHARLTLQSVAGPLAGAGHSCLFEAKDESWELRGCDMDWIS